MPIFHAFTSPPPYKEAHMPMNTNKINNALMFSVVLLSMFFIFTFQVHKTNFHRMIHVCERVTTIDPTQFPIFLDIISKSNEEVVRKIQISIQTQLQYKVGIILSLSTKYQELYLENMFFHKGTINIDCFLRTAKHLF